MNFLEEPTDFERTIYTLCRVYPEFGRNGYCCSLPEASPSPIPEDEFWAAVKGLKAIGNHIGLPKATHSYALKNCIEEMIGRYVSNGAVIAAANYLGFHVVRNIKGSPNARIKLPKYTALR